MRSIETEIRHVPRQTNKGNVLMSFPLYFPLSLIWTAAACITFHRQDDTRFPFFLIWGDHAVGPRTFGGPAAAHVIERIPYIRMALEKTRIVKDELSWMENFKTSRSLSASTPAISENETTQWKIRSNLLNRIGDYRFSWISRKVFWSLVWLSYNYCYVPAGLKPVS